MQRAPDQLTAMQRGKLAIYLPLPACRSGTGCAPATGETAGKQCTGTQEKSDTLCRRGSHDLGTFRMAQRQHTAMLLNRNIPRR